VGETYAETRQDDAADPEWYYRIELSPGEITPGKPRMTLALMRETMRRMDLVGARCLDIGAQEAAGAVSMRRLGAAEVVAYDRLDLGRRVERVAAAYDAPIGYVGGVPMHQLQARMREAGIDPVFDFVNFAGVLYHMMDPMAGLAMARSFLRQNGLMLIETSIAMKNNFNIKFNYRGQIYAGSNYFQISARTLDYWIRLFRMRVEDVIWRGADDVRRVLVVCRAMPEPVIGRGDGWARKRFHELDAAAYGLDYGALASDAPGPGFAPFEHERWLKGNLVDREAEHASLFSTVRTTPAHALAAALEELRLDHPW